MPLFRKKPVVVEAERFDPEHLPLPFGGRGNPCCLGPDGWFIETLEGDHLCTSGDWIIKGVKGEFYPCKPDIFEATYEIVEA